MTDYHRHTGGLVVPNNRQCWPEGCNRDSLVRHVIVLDPEGDGPDVMVELVEAYNSSPNVFPGPLNHKTADVWREVLTEYAKPEPPRPAEPGLWGVVEASCDHNSDREEWSHHRGGWIAVGRYIRAWDDLIDPTVIREGEGDD